MTPITARSSGADAAGRSPSHGDYSTNGPPSSHSTGTATESCRDAEGPAEASVDAVAASA